VLKTFAISLVICLCGLVTSVAADYSLSDGTTVSGEVISADNNGVIVKTGPDTYSEKTPWLKFSQAGLKQLAQNSKAKPFAEPFIEPDPTPKSASHIQVNEPNRLDLPKPGSLFGALFTSSVGLAIILLIYGANIFAGYEAAAFRARPVGLGIGLAAGLPIIGPIIVLCMPTVPPPPEVVAPEVAANQEEPHRFAMPGQAPVAHAPEEPIQIVASGFSGAPPPATSNTEVFQRGQFIFNRRFFETKFRGFFGIARGEADRGKVLTVKTPGALLTVERISQVTANDIQLEVLQGGERQEITVPFADIQQVQLTSKA
jgi:hypothetical protein